MIRSTLPATVTFMVYLISPVGLTAQLDYWDFDQDVMPNAWEYHRDLDVEDPKDAWADPDQDGVCNIYEYYLGTHPQDPTQPLILEYDGLLPLGDFIRSAPRGAVLRIPQGEYTLNYQHDFYDSPPRLVIQGGWNADFSERDHCKYLTTLRGTNDRPIFDFLIGTGNSSALVLDGFTLTEGQRGAVHFTSYISKAQLLIANCILNGNAATRSSAIVQYEDGDFTIISDVVIMNSTIADNTGTGLRVEQWSNLSNLKVLHSIIGYNKPSDNDLQPLTSGYGMIYSPGADSLMHVQMANSILWGNTLADVWFNDPDLAPVAVNSRYNIYGYVKRDSLSVPFRHISDSGLDPVLFQDNGWYYLGTNSPARGSGQNIGLTDAVHPDVGIVPCSERITTSTTSPRTQVPACHVFPNPAQQRVTVELFRPVAGQGHLYLYDPRGRRVQQIDIGFHPRGHHRIPVDLSALPGKTYWLQMVLQGQQPSRPILLIRE